MKSDIVLQRENLLQKAWKEYTKEWNHEDWNAAAGSMSSTATIDEFEHCEFYDNTIMEELLTSGDFKVWKNLFMNNQL